MTVAVPIQVFLVAAWVFSAIGGGAFAHYSKDADDGGLAISIVILLFSFMLLVVGLP